MKFILPIIFSLTLLTGCIKHTPEMDKQLALEQSLNEESNEEAPQPKKTTSEQSVPSTVQHIVEGNKIPEIIKQRILNFEKNRYEIIKGIQDCVEDTRTYQQEYKCTDTVYIMYNAINPSITSDRTYLYNETDLNLIQSVYGDMIKNKEIP